MRCDRDDDFGICIGLVLVWLVIVAITLVGS